jgi:hypothetical protein
MASKTTEGTTAKRTKKTAFPVPPAEVQADVQVAAKHVAAEPGKGVRKNGKQSTYVPANIEDAIRVRAYELYLERRATAGGEIGDENQDWLVAEREIRSRNGGHGQHTA